MTSFFRVLLSCGIAMLPWTALGAVAAAIDCSRAVTPAETTICADENLRQLDTRLAALYAGLNGIQPQRRALRRQQTQWVRRRDRCLTDRECLAREYRQRMDALRIQLLDATAYVPDAVDRQALADLRQAIDAARKTEAEFPLEKVIDSLRIENEGTHFSNVVEDGSDDGIARFPTTRPEGVSADEWQALLTSRIDGGGEHGHATYTLIDLDDDGQRDLIIDAYIGGTGLFSYVSVLRRHAERFEGAYTSLQNPSANGADTDAADPLDIERPYLYSINDRGANQSADWIRLRGRVYAAYRVSQYGVDTLYLLRPLTRIGAVPTLTLHYRYRLSVPSIQRTGGNGAEAALDESVRVALAQALASASTTTARYRGGPDKPLCPIPESVMGDARMDYFGYGAGHYSYEVIEDFPVWIDGTCFIGRLADWFGRYSDDHGLAAQLWLRAPGVEEAPERIYDVEGRRTAIRIDSAITQFEGGDGM